MPITALSEERLLGAAKALPATPRIMARLHALLLDANSGLDDIAQLLKCDVALSSRIIRIANSTAYKGCGIASVEDALQRVGYGEVFRLVGLATNAGLADGGLMCYGYSSEVFQRHNLMLALLAEGVARRRNGDVRVAYTAGLFRRVGRLLLDRVGRAWLSPTDSFAESHHARVDDWEREVFGITHREVGRLLLRNWGFPEEAVRTVAHDFAREVPPTALAQHLCVAEHLVRAAGCGLPLEVAPAEPLIKDLTLAGLSTDEADRILEDAMAIVLKVE